MPGEQVEWELNFAVTLVTAIREGIDYIGRVETQERHWCYNGFRGGPACAPMPFAIWRLLVRHPHIQRNEEPSEILLSSRDQTRVKIVQRRQPAV